MELTLEIINPDQAGPLQQLRKVFERRGGAIGRQEYADWVIVDAAKQVSRQHAYISYNGSHFCMRDVSTNGTRYKTTGEPLRPNKDERIEDGGIYLVGTLEIRAQLTNTRIESAASGLASGALIIPEDVDFRRLPAAATEHVWACAIPEIEPQQCADYAPIDREHLLVPTLVPPLPEPEPCAEPPLLPCQNEVFWQRFGRALGISVDDLNQSEREGLAVNTAHLFKVSIGNLQQSLRTRAELKNELRLLLSTGQYTRRNPIKHAATTSDAVSSLLLDGQSRMHAERLINRVFTDLQAHQVAMLGASRAALRSTLDHFAPQQLAQRFEREGHKPLFATDGSLWRAFGRYHQGLAQDDDWSERLLARDFARAYEEQVRLIDSLHTDPQG